MMRILLRWSSFISFFNLQFTYMIFMLYSKLHNLYYNFYLFIYLFIYVIFLLWHGLHVPANEDSQPLVFVLRETNILVSLFVLADLWNHVWRSIHYFVDGFICCLYWSYL